MKSKLFILLLLVASTFLLTGCTLNSAQNSDADSQNVEEDVSVNDTPKTQVSAEKKDAEIENILDIVSNTTGFTGASAMRLRRNVDSVSLDDEGKGFLVRMASSDEKLTTNEEIISVEMSGLNYEVKKFEPKSNSLVTKFYKFTNPNDVECTLEIRKVGTTGQSDLSFGCL